MLYSSKPVSFEELKQEIQHYNKLIEEKAEERKRLEEIEKAQQEEEFKRQEEERRKLQSFSARIQS